LPSALLGPLAGGALAARSGIGPAFGAAAACVVAAFLCLLLFTAPGAPRGPALSWRVLPALASAHRRAFATAGVAAIVFMLMRAARNVLLPLLGAELGLTPATIGVAVALSAAVDVLLFYPAGVAIDRYGRRATAIPSALLFTASLAALSLVDSFATLLAAGLALGIANGLSTGIVMTLGTDLAPADRRGEFLGLWRLLTDFGSAAGPWVVSAVVAFAPLAVASLAVAALGAGGSFVIWRYVEETLARRPPGPGG
jgi:MFS family permease